MSTPKIGRPRKHDDETVTWGMRVTKEGRHKIKELGKIYKKPASQIIMELVEKALNDINISVSSKIPKRYSAKEIRAMPREKRAEILKEQSKIAMQDFELIPDGFDILDD